jgi:glucose/arabinose dehydrogenase
MALTIGALLAAVVVFESTAHCAITGLERVATGLSSPMFATFAPGDSTHLFIGQRDGTIRVMNLKTGILASTPFLSIPSIDQDGEGGLLGMAFDPNYQTNGKFYVNATFPNSGSFQGASSGMATEIRQYSVSTTSSIIANPMPTPIISWIQPQTNHKAGWIGFNPQTTPGQPQYLYIPTGDGGSGNDNDVGHTTGTGNAQDITDNPLGKILRIDVSGDDFPSDATRNYKIPPTNPYVGVTGDDEIFAIGMRNPFRDSFDRATGDLWLGDVGQDTREEIDKLSASAAPGRNFGWRLREGNIQNPSDVGGAIPPNYVAPQFDYGRSGTISGSTVIGGYVYRGPDPLLQGKYFFSDTGDKYWMFDPADPTGTVTSIKSKLTPNVGSGTFPVSYAEDADGNLYVVYLATGNVYRIDTDFLLPGDFNRDRQLTAADVPAMLKALANLPAFQATNGLTDLSLDLIGDFNHDGKVTNSDIQSLLALIAAGGGALASVPEPASWLLCCIAAPIALASPRVRKRLRELTTGWLGSTEGSPQRIS